MYKFIRTALICFLITVPCVPNNVSKVAAVVAGASGVGAAITYPLYLKAKKALKAAPYGPDKIALEEKVERYEKALLGMASVAAAGGLVAYGTRTTEQEGLGGVEPPPALPDDQSNQAEGSAIPAAPNIGKVKVSDEHRTTLEHVLQFKQFVYDVQKQSNVSYETLKRLSGDGAFLNVECFDGKTLFVLLLENEAVPITVIKSCCGLLKKVSDKELLASVEREPDGTLLDAIFETKIVISDDQKGELLSTLLNKNHVQYEGAIQQLVSRMSHSLELQEKLQSVSELYPENVLVKLVLDLLKERKERNAAATKVQTLVRGHQAKKQFNDTKKQIVAAQSAVRGHQAQKRFKNIKDATVQLQARLRGKKVRDDLKERNVAATKIQALVRGKKVRDDLLKEYKEYQATKIQAAFRGKKVRDDLKKQHASATKFQAVVRGHQAKKTVGEEATQKLFDMHWSGWQGGNYVHKIRELVKLGAKINKTNGDGDTPLCLAAKFGHAGVIVRATS